MTLPYETKTKNAAMTIRDSSLLDLIVAENSYQIKITGYYQTWMGFATYADNFSETLLWFHF